MLFRGCLKVTADGRYLLVFPVSSIPGNLVFYVDMRKHFRTGITDKLSLVPVISEFGYEFQVSINQV